MLRFFKTKSLTKTLLAYLFMIGIFPLLFFGVLAIYNSNKVLKEYYINDHKINLKQRVIYINHIMDDIESLITNLSGVEEINDGLTFDKGESVYVKLETQARIGYILNGYSNLKGLISIDLFAENGNHYHVGETLKTDNINVELRKKLFEELKKSEDFIYWSGLEKSIIKDSKYKNLVVSATLIETKSNFKTESGILAVSYNPEVFSFDFMKDNIDKEYSIVIDNKGEILHHDDKSLIGEKFAKNLFYKLDKDEGYFEEKINNKDKMILYTKTENGNWTLVDCIDIKSIYKKSGLINRIFIALLIISLVTIFVFGYRISKRVVLPIRSMTLTFKSLQEGILKEPKRFELKTEDEIGILGSLFNSFIDAREDITLQKKLERKLNEQNLKLHDALEKLKETQVKMLQREKLAGIGQLAAGVAHEINNPLGFVSSNFETMKKYIEKYEMLVEELKKDIDINKYKKNVEYKYIKLWKNLKFDYVREDIFDIINDTDEGITRISNIVNGLKSFSRINKIEKRSLFNLNEGIKTTLLIVNNELKYISDVEFVENDIPQVEVDGGQINQVILNIIVNAAHAIKKKFENGEKGKIKINTKNDDKNLYLLIEDNGCGMNEETKNKIYEPFFTTKPEGEGTGLGLGIVYDIIVNKHKGDIKVESEEGVGTLFKIALPLNKLMEDEENIFGNDLYKAGV